MAPAVVFSGGTAFKETARVLARWGVEVRYLITTFDSGGSSQALRQVFAMPAVGDLRNRLLAIARNGAAAAVLNQRLPQEERAAAATLAALDPDRLLASAEEGVRGEIGEDLEFFLQSVPDHFYPGRASVGNMAMAGAWLRLGEDIDRVVRRYGALLQCVGEVIPICTANLHLAAHLDNGGWVVGQHLFSRLTARMEEVALVNAAGEAVEAEASPRALAAIEAAPLVIYPMGSFFSSIVANFLPKGVGRAVARCAGRKIFIPNVGRDAELGSMPIRSQVEKIIEVLGRDAGGRDNLLHAVMLDPGAAYPESISPALHRELKSLGVEVLLRPIAPDGSCHNAVAVAESLMELARNKAFYSASVP